MHWRPCLVENQHKICVAAITGKWRAPKLAQDVISCCCAPSIVLLKTMRDLTGEIARGQPYNQMLALMAIALVSHDTTSDLLFHAIFDLQRTKNWSKIYAARS
ncbi:hypothetical protein F1880_007173 [Penicillium rolfsii]|nr:hypothetical protein F1880_007173 [Penicillium rolfsii]